MRFKKCIYVLVFCFILTACSSNKPSWNSDLTEIAMATSAPQTENSFAYDSDGYAYEMYGSDEKVVFEEADRGEIDADTTSAIQNNEESKIIRESNISMTINDYDNIVEQIRLLTENAGGYIENLDSYIYSYDNDGRGYRYGSIRLRVPSSEFDSVKNAVKMLGKVSNERESSENVTQEYYDIESRLHSKRAEETRLIEMIGVAESISDLILLEERLSNVRTEIDWLEGRIRNIDRLVFFSTINLDLTEEQANIIEPVSPDLLQRIYSSFIGSVNGIIRLFEGLLIFLVGSSMQILVIVVLAVPCFFIVKKRKKSKNIKENFKDDDNFKNKDKGDKSL